jgi:lambda family phage portal protein
VTDNILERALRALAPGWALRREMARHAIRGFEAAGRGRRMRNWQASATNADAETQFALPTLRNRARDLVRNNPYAARAVDIVVAHQVGYGIEARPNTGSASLDRRVKDLWREWCAMPDVAGRLDFAGVQAMVARSRAESGEVLVRLFNRGQARVPLQLQILEADHLDETKTETLANGGRIIQGVELDATGQRVAYWLFNQHPGDNAAWSRASRISERVPASDVLHIYRQLRPGQHRGTPDLVPTVTRLRSLDDYQEAELERARVQACLAAFITSPTLGAGGPLGGRNDAESGERRTTLAPGMMERLLPGEDIEFVSPAGNGAYPDHVRTVLHAVAVGFGVTYHQLTGDLRDANYSSLRAGNIEFRRLTEQAQWLVLVPLLCRPLWAEFIRAAVLSGALRERRDGYAVDWVPPAFEAVDPMKDAQAIGERLRLQLTSPQREIAAQGYDPTEILRENAEWKDQVNAAGLPFPGQPIAPAAPAAAEAPAEPAEGAAPQE